ncbi:hypothetical protein [Algicella marina]|uniref:Uncharacterized protein n=1 Tax=Algicella marina TaxID=2683284 RepID=A0A6P1SUK1_9RHOB|nr:hypothetical protein [Algicella marina]QHQ34118.1 hypothetical protein GO499_02415 [Algicella marina]
MSGSWAEISDERRGLFLFLGVLPILNGLFDTLSYAATLALTQRGLRAGWGAVLYGLADFAVAALLFLALGATLVVVIAGMNVLSGVVLLDLVQVIGGLTDWRQYWWLYAMVFSTLLPTCVHFLIAALSLSAIVSQDKRLVIWGWIGRREADNLAAIGGALALGLLWFLAVALPVAAIGLLIWFGFGWLEWAAEGYLHWLARIALAVGGLD